MPRTTAGLRPDDRLSAAALDPAWRKWIDLVELAVEESLQPAWSGCVHFHENRPAEAPLLHGATIRLPARAREFAGRLAESLGIVALEAINPVTVMRIGIERDTSELESASFAIAIPTDTVSVLGQLCALPLLLNAAQTISPEASRSWQRGYCLVCGAWPSMVEMRGIQRERRMRCGCCGSDWLLPVLHCAFCDEIDHHKLGSLLSDGDEQHIRIDTCATCHGYLKTLFTLTTLPFPTLALKDMATVSFDLAARDRGYARPAHPGWQLRVEIVP